MEQGIQLPVSSDQCTDLAVLLVQLFKTVQLMIQQFLKQILEMLIVLRKRIKLGSAGDLADPDI